MGLAPNKDALLHVLCRKANMTYESFVTITQSVYMLQYMDKEKVGTRGGGGGEGQGANVTVWETRKYCGLGTRAWEQV